MMAFKLADGDLLDRGVVVWELVLSVEGTLTASVVRVVQRTVIGGYFLTYVL